MFGESLVVALESKGFDADHLLRYDSHAGAGRLHSAILRRMPDVVILNVDLDPVSSGSSLVEPLSRAGVDVVVVTECGDRVRCGEALSRGAKAVVFAEGTLDGLLVVLERLRDQLPAIAAAEREDLIEAYVCEGETRRLDRLRLEGLSMRENQILRDLMGGRSVVEIAATGVVSEATVRTQVKTILGKLGVSSQLQAVGMAHRHQWRSRGQRTSGLYS
ncbi:MAG: LuxR C-terminal-related transcriptional regulator [Nocardioides sp.]